MHQDLVLAAAKTAHQSNVVTAHPGTTLTIGLGLVGLGFGVWSFMAGNTSIPGLLSWLLVGLSGGGAIASLRELVKTASTGLQGLVHGSVIVVSVSLAVAAFCCGAYSWWHRGTTTTGAAGWWLVGASGGGVFGALVLGLATTLITAAIELLTTIFAS